MMIHGIYVRTKPTHKWYLFSVTKSAEAATKELVVAEQIAKTGGNETGEAVIQIFESQLFIPELLSEIKEQKLIGFN
jgi:hypothetical protein